MEETAPMGGAAGDGMPQIGMPHALSTVKPPSAAEAAYSGIVDLILARGLRPGERTSVNLLAARLGLGRMPVKEAVNRLQTEGMLSIKGRSGTTVTTIGPDAAAQMFALRRALEAFAAEGAALRATDDDMARVRALVEEMHATSIDDPYGDGAGPRFVRANSAFHAAVVGAAHNPFLDRAYGQLQLQLQIVSYLSYRGHNPDAARRRQREHEEIADALAARDAERLREALRQHGETTESALISQLP
ncbi:GntR family transcriptional regulator [Aquabacter spiritensis]|uniref:DNA-binding GntR family transcriptional regulator n=1 Tax=Aquabacter spiritensis TaxID=933073 RepID=A0A4V2UYB6_9HYPH|nr:GntR family transcriptional regulator [Aquabacter spiritensis]TCT06758.1 DNA-binding GntR family transcriptional regulator [Aquabacter spiritensis]